MEEMKLGKVEVKFITFGVTCSLVALSTVIACFVGLLWMRGHYDLKLAALKAQVHSNDAMVEFLKTASDHHDAQITAIADWYCLRVQDYADGHIEVTDEYNEDPDLTPGRCHRRDPAADAKFVSEKIANAKSGSDAKVQKVFDELKALRIPSCALNGPGPFENKKWCKIDVGNGGYTGEHFGIMKISQ